MKGYSKFEDVWYNIVKNEGGEFFTKTGLTFRYKVSENLILPDRTNYSLSKSNIEKAYELLTLDGPGKISNVVRGSAYVWAILTDNRIITV